MDFSVFFRRSPKGVEHRQALAEVRLTKTKCFFVDRRKALSTHALQQLKAIALDVFFRRSPKGVEHRLEGDVEMQIILCFFVDRRKALSTVLSGVNEYQSPVFFRRSPKGVEHSEQQHSRGSDTTSVFS